MWGESGSRLLPQFCPVHTPWPNSFTSPTLSAEARRLGQATSNSGYRIYSVSSLSLSLSAIRRDFHERQECRENDNRFHTYASRYKRRIISNNLCKKKCQDIFLWKRKRKRNGGGAIKVLEAFLIQNFIEG